MSGQEDLDGLDHAIALLDQSLGRGDWLEPGDYEALRSRYNTVAQAAEDVVTVWRRVEDAVEAQVREGQT
jgi:hypothetical protein